MAIITTKSYMNHLQCLLTHRIIKNSNQISRVKAAKLAKRILKYVDPVFVRPLCTVQDIQQRLIITDFNIGQIVGFYCDMPNDLNNTLWDIQNPSMPSE